MSRAGVTLRRDEQAERGAGRLRRSPRQAGRLYAVLAALAWSSAGILQRQLSVAAATQVAGRALFAFLALAALLLSTTPGLLRVKWERSGAVMASALVVASAAFVFALNHATVAHVLVLQALAPILAALLGFVALGEVVSRRTWLAMLIAVGGVVVMLGAPGGGSPLGEVLALITAVAFAVVIVAARHGAGPSTLPLLCASQFALVAIFAPLASTRHLSLGAVGWLALLGVGQTGLATAFFALAARSLPSAEMALILLLEVVLGPLWAWIGVSEQPSPATLAGGAVVVVAVAIQMRSSPRTS